MIAPQIFQRRDVVTFRLTDNANRARAQFEEWKEWGCLTCLKDSFKETHQEWVGGLLDICARGLDRSSMPLVSGKLDGKDVLIAPRPAYFVKMAMKNKALGKPIVELLAAQIERDFGNGRQNGNGSNLELVKLLTDLEMGNSRIYTISSTATNGIGVVLGDIAYYVGDTGVYQKALEHVSMMIERAFNPKYRRKLVEAIVLGFNNDEWIAEGLGPIKWYSQGYIVSGYEPDQIEQLVPLL